MFHCIYDLCYYSDLSEGADGVVGGQLRGDRVPASSAAQPVLAEFGEI